MLNPKMKYSLNALRSITEPSEGDKLRAYPDPGTGGEPWTIGYGHTGAYVHVDMVITQAQAEAFLLQDIAHAEAETNELVTTQITQHQFDALVDFAFNAGAGNLAKSSLLRFVNAHDFASADQEFAKWVYGDGHKLPGLVERRKLEANWFVTKDN